jgi:xanthine dehydrogenase accessory factor
MISPAASRRAQELAAAGVAFATATVVRAQRPTSAQAGNVALVLGDGTIEGFVGGACAEHSVRAYALAAIEAEEALLLRILPFDGDGDGDLGGGGSGEDEMGGQEIAKQDGAVTVQNPCLSGGAIEVFLEPVLPAPRLLVVGETPIAGAVRELATQLGLDLVEDADGTPEPAAGDLGLIVATHGRDELDTLRQGLERGVLYVGLVASHKRASGVLAELRGDGVPDELLERIDVPAGIDIGARTPAEVAVSILAELIAVRRGKRTAAAPAVSDLAAAGGASAAAPVLAVDPICGMTVAAVAQTASIEHDGETVYFCCDGCRTTFEAQHAHASPSD